MAFDNYSSGDTTFGSGLGFSADSSQNGYSYGGQQGYSQPVYGGQSGYPAQPNYGGQSGYPAQPNYGAQPGYPAQPNYDAQPGYSAQPNYGGQPGYSAQPNYGGQPGYTAQPDTNYYPGSQPAYQLKTNRALWKMILFSAITFGIYSIVVWSNIGTSINEAAGRYDGKHTMHYCLVTFLFSWLTVGILPLIWMSNTYARVGRELARRGIDYRMGAGTFWGWYFFGSLILVGPFIAMHKMCKGMNYICADYNVRG